MKTKKGAEATIKIQKEEVEKDRKKKNYRHKELDNRIRKERNKKETRIIKKARQNGVQVPEIQEKTETTFKMEKIQGKELKQKIEQKTELAEKLAVQVARLHEAEIIHGDLTTSNAIITPENQVYLIDFGLAQHSNRVEDKAVDIHLLKQILETNHAEKSKELWQKFQEKYSEVGSQEVLDKLPEIEQRARYK